MASNPRSSATSLMNGSKSNQSVDEMIDEIDKAIEKLSEKFTTVSSDIFSRMDEISTRLDSLEQSFMAVHVPGEISATGAEDGGVSGKQTPVPVIKENGENVSLVDASKNANAS